jgi:hypothetical protein
MLVSTGAGFTSLRIIQPKWQYSLLSGAYILDVSVGLNMLLHFLEQLLTKSSATIIPDA